MKQHKHAVHVRKKIEVQDFRSIGLLSLHGSGSHPLYIIILISIDQDLGLSLNQTNSLLFHGSQEALLKESPAHF